MKRIILFIIALCLILTACGVESEPEAQEPDIQEPEVIEPDIPEEVSPVYTDWSKLTPYENQTAVYSYYEPRSTDGHLQPRSDYGVLLPYKGADMMTEYDESTFLYGLVTTDGRIVTEPIYRRIGIDGDFIVLEKSKVLTSFSTEWNDTKDTYIINYTIAAHDGSWVRDVGLGYTANTSGDYLVILKEDFSLITFNKDGEILLEIPSSVMLSLFGGKPDLIPYPLTKDGSNCLVYDEYIEPIYLDFTTGEVLSEPPEWYVPGEDYYEEEEAAVSFPGYDHVYETIDRSTGKMYYIGETPDYRSDLLDETGTLLLKDCYYTEVISGLVSTIRDNHFCYYLLETGEVVFSYPIKNNLD